MSRCICGGNMIKAYDPIDGLWRIKCDNPSHNRPETEDYDAKSRTERIDEIIKNSILEIE